MPSCNRHFRCWCSRQNKGCSFWSLETQTQIFYQNVFCCFLHWQVGSLPLESSGKPCFFFCCICNWTLYDLDQNGDKCESFNISAFYFLFRAQSMPHSLLCFFFFFFPRRNVSIRRLATIYSLLVIQLHFFWTQLFIYKMEMIFQCYNK